MQIFMTTKVILNIISALMYAFLKMNNVDIHTLYLHICTHILYIYFMCITCYVSNRYTMMTK